MGKTRRLRRGGMAAALTAAVAVAGLVRVASVVPAQEAVLDGEVRRGDLWQGALGPGTRVELLPIEHGWRVRIGPADDASTDWILVSPGPFVPPASLIEGWHFRNADNTGPNEPGPRNVNAPGEERSFRFGPDVPALEEEAADAARLEAALTGEATLRITALELGGLEAGRRAHIDRMSFTLDVRCLRLGCLEGGASPPSR